MPDVLRLEEGVCTSCLCIEACGVQATDSAEDVEAFVEASIRERGWELVPDCGEDCSPWFSWTPCGWCRRPLGGDRHPAVLIAHGR